MVYGKKQFKKMKAGKGSCVIKLGIIYSPALVPNYKWEGSNSPIILSDLPENAEIVLPISMIKEHVDARNIRATPIESHHREDIVGRSKPALINDHVQTCTLKS